MGGVDGGEKDRRPGPPPAGCWREGWDPLSPRGRSVDPAARLGAGAGKGRRRRKGRQDSAGNPNPHLKKSLFWGQHLTPSLTSLRRTGHPPKAPAQYQQDPGPGKGRVFGEGQHFTLKVRKETPMGPDPPLCSPSPKGQPAAGGPGRGPTPATLCSPVAEGPSCGPAPAPTT